MKIKFQRNIHMLFGAYLKDGVLSLGLLGFSCHIIIIEPQDADAKMTEDRKKLTKDEQVAIDALKTKVDAICEKFTDEFEEQFPQVKFMIVSAMPFGTGKPAPYMFQIRRTANLQWIRNSDFLRTAHATILAVEQSTKNK